MSVICAVNRDHVCLCSVFPPETMWKSMIHAAAGFYGQGSFFCSGVDDYRLINENERH